MPVSIQMNQILGKQKNDSGLDINNIALKQDGQRKIEAGVNSIGNSKKSLNQDLSHLPFISPEEAQEQENIIKNLNQKMMEEYIMMNTDQRNLKI